MYMLVYRGIYIYIYIYTHTYILCILVYRGTCGLMVIV